MYDVYREVVYTYLLFMHDLVMFVYVAYQADYLFVQRPGRFGLRKQ